MIIRSDDITTTQIRQLLRDPANRTDRLLIGLALAKGVLSPRYAQSTPSACLQIEGELPVGKYGTGKLGAKDRPKLRYREDLKFNRVVPEAQYNPLTGKEIQNGMKLGKGLTLSRFAKGNLHRLNDVQKREFAKYAYLHSLLINSFRSMSDRFSKYSLEIEEGLFWPETNQNVTPGSHLDLARNGRLMVYEVRSKDGSDLSATFNVAKYLKDNALFQELILSYDSLDPNQDCTGQIIVIMPEVDDYYRGEFTRKVCTHYNFRSALRKGLAELAV